MPIARLLVCVSALMLLTACAGTYRTYADMFRVALTPKKDHVLTFGDLAAASNDYLYVRYRGLPQAVLGLTYIENEQFKWVSADNAMLITDQGRIVKTIALENDLLFVSNLANDPLKRAIIPDAAWIRATDWQSGEFGLAMQSRFSVSGNEQLQFFNHPIMVTRVVEQVALLNKPPFWRFDDAWQNIYWINATNGQVLKSEQQLAPGLPRFELVFISEVMRHFIREGIAIAEDAI